MAVQNQPPEREPLPDEEKGIAHSINKGVQLCLAPAGHGLMHLTALFGSFVSSPVRWHRGKHTFVLTPRESRPPRTEYELGRTAIRLQLAASMIAFLVVWSSFGMVGSSGLGMAVVGALPYLAVVSWNKVDAVEVSSKSEMRRWGDG